MIINQLNKQNTIDLRALIIINYNKKHMATFKEVCDTILSHDDQRVEMGNFVCPSSHFTAKKQREIVDSLIESGVDLKTSNQAHKSKGIVTEILKELEKKQT